MQAMSLRAEAWATEARLRPGGPAGRRSGGGVRRAGGGDSEEAMNGVAGSIGCASAIA